jgi:L,D-transpeptidase YcbB
MIKSTVYRQFLSVLLATAIILPVTYADAVLTATVSYAQDNGADSFLEKIRKKKAAKLLAKQQKAAAVRKAKPQTFVDQNSDDGPSIYDEDAPAPKPKKQIAAVPPAATTQVTDDHSAPVVAGSKVSTVTEVVESKNISPMLFADSVQLMQDAAARYRNVVAQGGFPKVGRSGMKRNSKGKGVIALNQRLFAEGYLRSEATQGEFAGIYTTATEDAVRRYQQNMGLNATGKFDAATSAQMNVPAEKRLFAIEANIARVEVYSKDLSDRYLIVNVPAQQIEAVNGGKVYARHNAIVGRPARPTPVAITALSDVNFNPYWNAPVSIVERDLFPKMVSSTQILDDMNIRVFQGFGGPEVDPSTVDWKSASADDYHFRQEPGEHNAMATAKINFPSPFGIYLHDTPEKHLFNSSQRFFSSGCVRVQNMPMLVNWVLNGQEGIGQAEISTLAETLERRDVALTAPPQLRVVYLTAWPTQSGTVAFRNDVYELDGTGFVTGQPMPVGELSPDGQRFVLKPLPRLVEQVDDSGGGGVAPIGSSSKKVLGTGKPDAAKLKVDPQAEAKPKAGAKSNLATATDKKKPGFDWAKWRKEQAEKSKLAKEVAAKKEPVKSAKAKAKVEKPVAEKLLKPKAEPKKVAALPDKKAKPAAVESKSTVTKVKSKPLDCKPLKDGKLPKGCAPAVEAKKTVKPLIKPTAKPAEKTAAN